MNAITFSNPRIEATFADWPIGGGKRGQCRFWVEYDKRGWRFGKQTFGKPKFATYGGQAAIVDGDDGRTYLLQACPEYGFIDVKGSDFKNAYEKSTVFERESPERYAELCKLILTGGALALSLVQS